MRNHRTEETDADTSVSTASSAATSKHRTSLSSANTSIEPDAVTKTAGPALSLAKLQETLAQQLKMQNNYMTELMQIVTTGTSDKGNDKELVENVLCVLPPSFLTLS